MINGVMGPRVGLIATDASGWPMLPQTAQVVIGGQTITAPVWSEYFACTIGSYPAREYRDLANGRLVTVVRIASVTLPDGRAGALAIAWVPATTRGGDNATYDLVISGPTMAPNVAAQWAVAYGADGSMTVPDLDADTTAAGLVAQAAWPASWRVLLATDPQGSLTKPAGPPTGPRILGEAIA